ncbi:MAG: dephospho-CoA kinase [bacterium]
MIIGLTGNIGSGKSTVADEFIRHGAVIIEGDSLGHEIVDRFPDYRDWLTKRFGPEIWREDDSLDRKELGHRAFSDSDARDDLTHESWARIRQLLDERIASVLSSGSIPVVDAAMIYEWGDEERYDVIVAVIVDPALGATRAAERLGLPPEEMMARYRTQVPAEEKAARADYVIRNDGSLEDLRRSANDIWTALTSKH